jgi:hypothetical protein
MTGPVDDRKTNATIKTPITIGQIISALDDRNLLRAMRLLAPASESAELSDGPRCVKCVTRGE